MIGAALVLLLAGGAEDPWDLARTAPDGPARTAALVASLADSSVAGLVGVAVGERLEVAFRAFLDAERRTSADEMLALAEALVARDRAVWSAFCLEGALRRGFGRYAEADAALAAVPATDPGAALALLERRALVAGGAGDTARETALYGAALARGSSDARQVLGFRALRTGDRAAAAAHFGALIDPALAARDLPPWALRGHGLALLPAPR